MQVFFEIFPVLESMRLFDLPKLQEICDTTICEGSNALQNLKALYLRKLPALKHLWNSSNQWISLNSLSSIEIYDCEMMEHVFSNEENEKNGNSSHMTFSKLKEFAFEDLPSLTTLFYRVESIDFPALETMNIENCPNLVRIVHSTGCNQNYVADKDGDDSCHLFCCPKVHINLIYYHVENKS